MKFEITNKNVDAFDAAIHHIRDNIQGAIYPTIDSENQARAVLADLLSIFPKHIPEIEPPRPIFRRMAWNNGFRGPMPPGGAA